MDLPPDLIGACHALCGPGSEVLAHEAADQAAACGWSEAALRQAVAAALVAAWPGLPAVEAACRRRGIARDLGPDDTDEAWQRALVATCLRLTICDGRLVTRRGQPLVSLGGYLGRAFDHVAIDLLAHRDRAVVIPADLAAPAVDGDDDLRAADGLHLLRVVCRRFLAAYGSEPELGRALVARLLEGCDEADDPSALSEARLTAFAAAFDRVVAGLPERRRACVQAVIRVHVADPDASDEPVYALLAAEDARARGAVRKSLHDARRSIRLWAQEVTSEGLDGHTLGA